MSVVLEVIGWVALVLGACAGLGYLHTIGQHLERLANYAQEDAERQRGMWANALGADPKDRA